MAAPIDLRNDFDSVSLRRLAKRTRDATQSRRLLALAEVYDGGSRTDASRIGGVSVSPPSDSVAVAPVFPHRRHRVGHDCCIRSALLNRSRPADLPYSNRARSGA